MKKKEKLFSLIIVVSLIFIMLFFFAFLFSSSEFRDKVFGFSTFGDGSDPALQAWLKFDDDIDDESATDSAGSNDGSCSGESCPTYLATGGHDGNGAYEFDGSSSILNIGDSAFGIDESNEFSISAWINPESIDYDVVIKRGATTPFYIKVYSNRTYSRITTSSANSIMGNTYLQPNEWYQVVVTYTDGERKMYLNGVADGSNSPTGVLDTTTSDTKIGGSPYFKGIIDDVRIYNRVLSSSEVSDLYDYSETSSSEDPPSEDPPSEDPLPEGSESPSGGGDSPTTCSNGVVDGEEVCDGTALNDETCITRGFDSGVLACLSSCLGYDTSGCIGECQESWVCGAWSDCIGGLRTRTCTDETNCRTISSKPPETRDCVNLCEEDWNCVWSNCVAGTQTKICLDLNNCGTEYDRPMEEFNDCEEDSLIPPGCGNNLIERLEFCDGTDLGGEDCVSLGFGSGNLGCNFDCSEYNVDSCVFDFGEDCVGECASKTITRIRIDSENPVEGLETVIQSPAEINKDVLWIKKVKVSDLVGNVSLDVPEGVEGVRIRKFVNSLSGKDLDKEDIKKLKTKFEAEFESLEVGEIGIGISEDVYLEEEYVSEEEKKNLLGSFVDLLSNFFKQLNAEKLEAYLLNEENQMNVIVGASFDEIEIEYVTSAPQIAEVEISPQKKEVTIYSDNEFGYENILAYTDIPEVVSRNDVSLFWIVNGSPVLVPDFNLFDTDANGLLDKIEWIVPHLSNQIYWVDVGGNTQGLEIWDSVEGSNAIVEEQVIFYVNYTTESVHIPGATCNINFGDGSFVMTESGSNYVYSRNFSVTGMELWNVSCSAVGYSTLKVGDDVVIGNTLEEVLFSSDEVEENSDFSIDKESIEVELTSGSSMEKSLFITNNDNVTQSFDLTISFDLKEFVSLSEESFVLESDETKEIKLSFNANSMFSIYTGNLKVDNGNREEEVFIVLSIEEFIGERMGVELIIPEKYKQVAPGEELVLGVTLTNLAGGSMEVPVNYIIKDFRNNILISREDIVPVAEKVSFFEPIEIPSSMVEWDYIAVVKTEYGSSSSVFSVRKPAYVLLEFEYDKGYINLISKSLEDGKSPTINHDSNKEYEVFLFSEDGEVLSTTSFENPSRLFSDVLDGEEMDGGVMNLGKTNFYLTVPESKESDKIVVFKQGVEIIQEEVYDVGAQSCRIR
jgi:hypothetical protein